MKYYSVPFKKYRTHGKISQKFQDLYTWRPTLCSDRCYNYPSHSKLTPKISETSLVLVTLSLSGISAHTHFSAPKIHNILVGGGGCVGVAGLTENKTNSAQSS